jgi:hypothetical protein
MFAHQVIDSLQDRIKNNENYIYNDKGYLDFISHKIDLIKISQQFHVGYYEKFPIKEPKCMMLTNKDQILTTGVVFEDLSNTRLPYPVCWVDFYTEPVQWYGKTENPLSDGKFGILCEDNGEDVITCTHFQYNPYKKYWQVQPIESFFKYNYDFKKDGQYIEFDAPDCMIYNDMDEIQRNVLKMNILKDTSFIFAMLRLFSCKNITTETVQPPEKLNIKRRKNGKQELFSYHVLNVTLPSQKQGYREKTDPNYHVRVHLCRGHFKEYTNEHPLFGSLTGRYWWQPHVRGQNHNGVVMKDYEVKQRAVA